MAKNEFEIDGTISQYYFDARYVKYYLNQFGNGPVICNISSYGGDFLIASNIKDEFAKHSNVTVNISGFAASAATYITLGAKHVRMSSSSFYLIHKVMAWVEAWGAMNNDQISELLADLEKIKDQSEKMTLVAAKAYSEKSGKNIQEILSLMKEQKWLTAEEAKEWGFIDEIYNTTSSKPDFTNLAEKFHGLGLPELPGHSSDTVHEPDNIVSQILEGMKKILPKNFVNQQSGKDNQQIINTTQMKNFNLINAVLAVTALESNDGKGVYLNEAQMQIIESALSDRDCNIQNLQSKETAYNNSIKTINALHPDIDAADTFENKIEKIREKLAKKLGIPPSGTIENKQPTNDGVDWETLNSLDHMSE